MSGGVRLGSPWPWLASLLFWSAVGVAFHLHEHLYWRPDEPLWPAIAINTIVEWLPFAPITPPLFAIAPAILRLGAVRRVLALIATLATIVVLHLALREFFRIGLAAAGAAVERNEEQGSMPFVLLRAIAIGAPYQSLHYLGVVGAALVFAHRARERAQERRAEQLTAELSLARLQALKSQLQPHFLFNALHAVGVTARGDGEAAARMIALLGDVLRSSLDERDAQLVALDRELARLEPYLEIQRMRFGDRLEIEVDADPAARAERVPSLLLLPLVENAIRHGVERVTGACAVRIAARKADAGGVAVTVEDDGEGLADGAREGIGLGHTRRRLEVMYGGRASIAVERRDGAGARVVVRLPPAPAELS